MSMTRNRTLFPTSLQLLTITVACMMMGIGFPAASAQSCDPSTEGSPLKVYNCTGMEYIIEFLGCCDYRSIVSPPFPICPQSIPPVCEEIGYASPATCAAIGVVSIMLPPPGSSVLDLTTRSLFLN